MEARVWAQEYAYIGHRLATHGVLTYLAGVIKVVDDSAL